MTVVANEEFEYTFGDEPLGWNKKLESAYLPHGEFKQPHKLVLRVLQHHLGLPPKGFAHDVVYA